MGDTATADSSDVPTTHLRKLGRKLPGDKPGERSRARVGATSLQFQRWSDITTVLGSVTAPSTSLLLSFSFLTLFFVLLFLFPSLPLSLSHPLSFLCHAADPKGE